MQSKSNLELCFGHCVKATREARKYASSTPLISGLIRGIFAAMFTSAALALVGCGSSSGEKSFALAALPSSISVVPGGTPQALVVSVSPVNGFIGSTSVALSGLPSGVTASPSTLSLSAGALGQFTISAADGAPAGNATITLTGTSGAISKTTTSSLTVAPRSTSATLSTDFYDFGNNLVNNSVTKTVAVVTNTGTSTLTMSPTLSGDPSYTIVADQSCGASLEPAATCNLVLTYHPTVASTPKTQDAALNMGFGDVSDSTPQTVSITGTSAALSEGTVTATNNPQVALYTMTLPFPGSMTVQFGTTSSYGLTTWAQSTDTAGDQVSILVAGMKASTLYHMAATIQFSNGITVTDKERTFTTGAVPNNPGLKLALTTSTTPGLTPQPGLELLDPLTGIVITDLSGNTVWTYANPGTYPETLIQGVKMMDNGDILMAIGIGSGNPLQGPTPADAFIEIREVNLAGDTQRDISISDLNAELSTATCSECQVTLQTFHHDVTPLPDGGWLVLANALMDLSATTKPALTNAPAQTVLGDVVVVLDKNLHPVWVWNEFNHLDPNRHPMQFPDWTHSNAVVYSPDDGNILISMRHQNWVIKVDYVNGSGTGKILWRLGEGGDFTLKGGTDPTDWEYAQHAPSFFSNNTSGVFSLGLMDNGNDRIFPSGVQCNATGGPPCLYTTAEVFQLDEGAKTATITFHQKLPIALFSFFGGNAEELANGNVEYDLCGLNNGSLVNEVTQEDNPKTVWSMGITGKNFYRAFRIPSLYPGVQW
jgi:arylsulfate sulfotransferase